MGSKLQYFYKWLQTIINSFEINRYDVLLSGLGVDSTFVLSFITNKFGTIVLDPQSIHCEERLRWLSASIVFRFVCFPSFGSWSAMNKHNHEGVVRGTRTTSNSFHSINRSDKSTLNLYITKGKNNNNIQRRNVNRHQNTYAWEYR